MEAIEALARESGTAVEVIGVSIRETQTGPEKVPKETDPDALLRLDLDVSGTFPDLFHLLSLIEQLPYAVALDQFGIEREEGGGALWGGAWSIRVAAGK